MQSQETGDRTRARSQRGSERTSPPGGLLTSADQGGGEQGAAKAEVAAERPRGKPGAAAHFGGSQR